MSAKSGWLKIHQFLVTHLKEVPLYLWPPSQEGSGRQKKSTKDG